MRGGIGQRSEIANNNARFSDPGNSLIDLEK
jgi:hypothetical protein